MNKFAGHAELLKSGPEQFNDGIEMEIVVPLDFRLTDVHDIFAQRAIAPVKQGNIDPSLRIPISLEKATRHAPNLNETWATVRKCDKKPQKYRL